MSHQSINESDARGHGLNKPRLESSEPTNILSQPNYISNITIDRQLVVYSHGCCKANEVWQNYKENMRVLISEMLEGSRGQMILEHFNNITQYFTQF